MKTIATLFASAAIIAAGVATFSPIGDAQAASKRTGCVTNATNTNQHACDTHVRRKQTFTVPTTHRNNSRKFNFGSDASYSSSKQADPGGGGGRR